MLTGKQVAAIAAGAVAALGGTGFGLALAQSKTGSAMKHETGAAMQHSGSAMHEAPTTGATSTG